MPAYTIVTTSATQGSEAAEVNTLTDEFADASEAIGYSRRMAEEMINLAHQLSLDFDYSNVGLYDGDLLDEDLDPDHQYTGIGHQTRPADHPLSLHAA